MSGRAAVATPPGTAAGRAAPGRADLEIEGLSKRFGRVVAIDDAGLDVRAGEFVTLLGPSGCGKTTILNAIAGLERPDRGAIRIGGRVVVDVRRGIFVAPEHRACGVVFQSYALWPHMTVRDNLAFPLRLRRVPAAERARRIRDGLDLVEMGAFADRFPGELSGGQQQRVALARTLVYQPSVLLLDEPLSSLDAKLRERARAWLRDLQARLGLTTIHVTHDQAEALALSDRIAVMRAGRIVQVADPVTLYQRPADPFVADFVGTTNFLTGTAAGSAGGLLQVRLDDGSRLAAASDRAVADGTPVIVAIRPETIELVGERGDGSAGAINALELAVVGRSYLGARTEYDLAEGGLALKVATRAPLDARDRIRVVVPPEACLVFVRPPAGTDAGGAHLSAIKV